MTDENLTMWSYWRDKYGPIEALKEHYPEKAKELAPFVAQAESALIAIDNVMTDAEQEAIDEQYDESG